MEKIKFSKHFFAVIAAFGLLFSLTACGNQATGDAEPSDSDITWTATANTQANAINFEFARNPGTLTSGDITVLDGGSGSITLGNLTGSGLSRALGITVHQEGTIFLQINRAGISSQTITVTVGGEDPDLRWALVAAAGAPTPAINITFSADPETIGLTASHFSIHPTGTTAAATLPGTWTGTGLTRALDISVTQGGVVYLYIDREGIVSGPKPVLVFLSAGEAVGITWQMHPSAGAPTPSIIFTFSEPPIGLTADDFEIDNAGTGAATLGALSGTGTGRTLTLSNVERSGVVNIRIVRPGIATGWQEAAIMEAPNLTWTAATINSSIPWRNAMGIELTFSGNPGLLQTGDFFILDGTTRVNLIPEPNQTGNSRTLTMPPLTLQTAGRYYVQTAGRQGPGGIEAGTLRVRILRNGNAGDPPADWSAEVYRIPTAQWIWVTFEEDPGDNVAISVTPVGAASVNLGVPAPQNIQSPLTWFIQIQSVNTPGEMNVAVSINNVPRGQQTVTISP